MSLVDHPNMANPRPESSRSEIGPIDERELERILLRWKFDSNFMGEKADSVAKRIIAALTEAPQGRGEDEPVALLGLSHAGNEICIPISVLKNEHEYVKAAWKNHPVTSLYARPAPQPAAEREALPQMFKWWRDRFDDIADDAKVLLSSAPKELHGAIEGIRIVAEQGRDGMDRLAAAPPAAQGAQTRGGEDALIRYLTEQYTFAEGDEQERIGKLIDTAERLSAPRSPAQEAQGWIAEDSVEWVVNDIAELGVKIGNQFFFLYKGHSLVYGTSDDGDLKDGVALHDNGTPMHWRPVGKREFGECCHPVNYEDLRRCGYPHYIGTVNLADSDEWKPLPAAPVRKEG